MKSIKKLLAVALVLMLVLSLATTALAEEENQTPTVATYTITINNKNPGHTYDAYQIFKGKLSNAADPDKVDGTDAKLSDIQWGDNVTYTGQGVVVGKDDQNKDVYSTEAADIAVALTNGPLTVDQLIADLTLGAPAATSVYIDTEKNKEYYEITGLVAGYYLVKDRAGTLNGEYDAYTDYIVEVVENSVVSPKSSVPKVEKKVFDINDTTGGEEVREDSADHDIGDDVTFEITATLGKTVESYKTYKIIFHDTMQKGLTLNENSVQVTVDKVNKTDGFALDYETDASGVTTITISCDDVKAMGATNESVIVVTYTAKLNENANLGAVGNKNTVYLEFSNDPSWDVQNPPADPDNPGKPLEEPTGETPSDEVIVFTYQAVVNKVDNKGNALAGAEFTLSKKVNGNWDALDTVVVDQTGTTFTWKGLDDGTYKLEETVIPEGFNAMEPIEFEITAEHDEVATNPELKGLDASVTNGGDNITFSFSAETGVISTTVKNMPGAVLPETGGMGTTIFYIIGGVLVVAAVVLLVTKKRMSSAE